jgi:hypothetical protein
MKKVILLFSILVLFSNVCLATINNKTEERDSVKIGVLTFEKLLHNFDTIKYAGDGTYEFKFKNTGNDTIIISNAKGSCGCTVPTYPKNKAILPGSSEVIKVTYDTKRQGSFSKNVTITSNASENYIILKIKGFVKAKVIEPSFPTNGVNQNSLIPLENYK